VAIIAVVSVASDNADGWGDGKGEGSLHRDNLWVVATKTHLYCGENLAKLVGFKEQKNIFSF
jgi:hypothetical protein